jgi:hypothetical protein
MGQLISALFPQCFPNKDACSATAAVVLQWGESGGKPGFHVVSTCFPNFSMHIRFLGLCPTSTSCMSVGADNSCPGVLLESVKHESSCCCSGRCWCWSTCGAGSCTTRCTGWRAARSRTRSRPPPPSLHRCSLDPAPELCKVMLAACRGSAPALLPSRRSHRHQHQHQRTDTSRQRSAMLQ